MKCMLLKEYVLVSTNTYFKVQNVCNGHWLTLCSLSLFAFEGSPLVTRPSLWLLKIPLIVIWSDNCIYLYIVHLYEGARYSLVKRKPQRSTLYVVFVLQILGSIWLFIPVIRLLRTQSKSYLPVSHITINPNPLTPFLHQLPSADAIN